MLEKKVILYNILFSIITFAKPSYDNKLQPLPLRDSGCNTLSHSGLAYVNLRNKMFYPLSKKICKGLDQPENPHSLTRVIAVRMKINLSSI